MRIILGIVLTGLIGGTVHQLYLRAITAREVQEAVAELDRSDPGWRFEEIEAQRKRLPAEENSAVRFQAVRELLPKRPLEPGNAPGVVPTISPVLIDGRSALDLLQQLSPPEQLSAEQSRKLRAELQRVQPALAEARGLVDLLYGRDALNLKLDVLNTIVDEMQERRVVVDLLAFDAILHSQDNDLKKACISVGAALNTARSVGEEPTVIVLLIRIACTIVGIDCLERTLAQGEPDEESLARVEKLLKLEDEESQPALVATLRGERAVIHRMFKAVDAGQFTMAQAIGESKGPPSLQEKAHAIIEVWVVRHAHAVYLQRMSAWVQAARLPSVEQSLQLAQIKAVPIDKTATIGNVLTSHFEKIFDASHREQALLRCARAALAAERSRRTQKRWPDSLDELTPQYLPEPLLDPFDDEPLRFRRMDDGILIYSVGSDGVDNGGDIDRQHRSIKGVDLGFRLWDVAKRRQPAPP